MDEPSTNREPKMERYHRRFDRTDAFLLLLLVSSGGTLAGGMVWPTLAAWIRRPRAGVQRPMRLDVPAGKDRPAVMIDYLLYLPQGYREENHDWPLVLFLHGAGDRGTDLGKVEKYGPPSLVAEGRAFPFVLVSPQCLPDRRWEPSALLRLIDHLTAKYRVDTDRLYVTGYSMGGFGTWALATAAPERIAAIAPLAGGGNKLQAEHLASVSIWAFHGAVDQTVPLEASQSMVDAVRAVGGDVRLTVYEDEGHGIEGITYAKAELWNWLLAQRRGGRGDAVME